VAFPQGVEGLRPNDRLFIRFRKFLHDLDRRMIQPPPPTRNPPEAKAMPVVDSPPPPPPPPPSEATVAAPPEALPAESKREEEDALMQAVKQEGGGEGEVRYVTREGAVDAVKTGDLLIVRGLFAIEEDIKKFVGLRVAGTGVEGCIVGPFGKGGKAKVQCSGTFAGGVDGKVTLYVPEGFEALRAP
jgi:hypothetical protein